MKYTLYCYNNKNRLVYKIDVTMSLDKLKKQMEQGYVEFFDSQSMNTCICYLNIYNKVVIEGSGCYE